MTFTFEVGDQEKHQVRFNFNRHVGNLEIVVDGKTVVSELRIAQLSKVRKHEFPVGTTERHNVAIEKERKLFFSGLRKQKYRVFVDERLTQEIEGY